MTNPESGMTGRPINAKVIEEIRDYDNVAIRAMLTGAGIVQQGDVITPDDYEATRSRAAVLAKESKNIASTEELLFAAFVDRMTLVERLGDEAIKNIPNETLRSIMYVDTGYKPSDEELEMLRRSPFGLKEWEKKRATSKGGNEEFDVAVDEEGTVVARGISPKEAMRHARDERGQQI